MPISNNAYILICIHIHMYTAFICMLRMYVFLQVELLELCDLEMLKYSIQLICRSRS
jgi:hypothetical protein